MRLLSVISAVFAFTALPLLAQQQQQQQGPHPKSQKELQALQKVQTDQQSQNWDQEIQDINYVLENFADTDYKDMLLNMAMEASQRKGDYASTVAFGEKIIQANPNDITARVTLAENIAQHIRENDLDKDQSIKKVNDYADKALELLKTSNTPPLGIQEAQWPAFKQQLEAQAHDAKAMALAANKDYPKAIEEYKTALAASPNPIIMSHMTTALITNKQYDEAIATADKVLASADASPAVKQFAQQQKDAATKAKGGAAAPAPTPK